MWLEETLLDGPVPAAELETMGRQRYSPDQIRGARERLNAKPSKAGSQWIVSL